MSGDGKGEWAVENHAGAASQALPRLLALPWPCPDPASRLLLVLAFSGCVEVIQHTLDILEGGPLLWAVPPAACHDVVELLWTVVWSRHPVPMLQRPDHLWVGHSWEGAMELTREGWATGAKCWQTLRSHQLPSLPVSPCELSPLRVEARHPFAAWDPGLTKRSCSGLLGGFQERIFSP